MEQAKAKREEGKHRIKVGTPEFDLGLEAYLAYLWQGAPKTRRPVRFLSHLGFISLGGIMAETEYNAETSLLKMRAKFRPNSETAVLMMVFTCKCVRKLLFLWGTC